MTQIHQFTSEQVYKHFMSDCLYPSLEHAVSASILYDLWKQYCHSIGYAPGSVNYFGRLMASRFQKTTRQGRSYYYCEIKPDIFEEEVNGQDESKGEQATQQETRNPESPAKHQDYSSTQTIFS